MPDTPSLTEKALSLKARILSGEKVPIPDLIAFLEEKRKTLQKDVQKKQAPPSDVDFF